jgi:adenylate cyclase
MRRFPIRAWRLDWRSVLWLPRRVPYEIERKFLVTSDAWKQGVKPIRITQGYLSRVNERVVRVRLTAGKGWLTVKGKSHGPRRREYEYEIPHAHAAEMLDQLCERPLLDKLRYEVRSGDVLWEVDEFLGENAGLVVAEVELPNDEPLSSLPEWVGAEVTDDPRYSNNHLVAHPFSTWK